MKFIGGRLGKWEKAKWGESLRLNKEKNGETETSFMLVGTGSLKMSIYITQRWYLGNKVTVRGSLVLCSLAVVVP